MKPLNLHVSWPMTEAQVSGGLPEEIVQSVHPLGENIEILKVFSCLGNALVNNVGSCQEVFRRNGLARADV